MEEENMSNFVYLIQEREFIKTKEPIYKIGMTTKSDLSRIKTYPKGSMLLFYSICNNCKTMETELIELFKSNFTHRKDIGSEYFEGDYKDMIHFCYQTLFDENNKGTTEQILSVNKNIELKNIKKQKRDCKKYNCTLCKKQYSSYKSFWNHNKKFEEHHKIILINQNNSKKIKNESSNQLYQYKCKYCNQEYKYIQSRHKHEKTCKVKIEKDKEKEKEKQVLIETQRMKEEAKKEKVEAMLERAHAKLEREKARIRKEKIEEEILKIRLEKAKQRTNNRTKPSVNRINQQIVQNYQIIEVGKEQDIPLILTPSEKMSILESGQLSLRKIIEILHGGDSKYKQFRSVIITNLRNKYLHKYDDVKKEFIADTMEDVIEILINSRLRDLETICDQNISKIDELSKQSLKHFINEMREPGSDIRSLEIKQIKMLLFNDRDKLLLNIEDDLLLVINAAEVTNNI